MSARRLLCLTLSNAQTVRERCGGLDGWDLCVARSIQDAVKKIKHEDFLVGLLLDDFDSDAERLIGLFSRTVHIRWLGIFSKRASLTSRCQQMIADHLSDYYTWPVDSLNFLNTLGHAHGCASIGRLPITSIGERKAPDITGSGAAIQRLRSQIRRVAQADAPVLICGETGTGKELSAHAIHAESPRKGGPFVAINCGAIPAGLIQAELFGHERGAFTGALIEKKGMIESAQNGTLFLDEIAELPRDLQANLLRFLQEKTIYRVGGTKTISVNARIIAASHVDLQRSVDDGSFREDLFFRLNVLDITVPPLRDRREDLLDLVNHFFKLYEADKSPQLEGFDDGALSAIFAHFWPGNVRELINRVRRAIVFAEGRLITASDLGLDDTGPTDPINQLGDSRNDAEKQAIVFAMTKTGSNITHAAKELGISRMTLYRLLAKHNLPTPAPRKSH